MATITYFPAASSGGTGTSSAPISGDGSVGTPYTATAAALQTTLGIVHGRTTLAAASATITISGLHGDTEGDYWFKGVLLMPVIAAFNSVTFLPNADASNGRCEIVNASSTAASGVSKSSLFMAAPNTTAATRTVTFLAFLSAKKGKGVRYWTSNAYFEDATQEQYISTGWWTNTSDEITSVVFSSNQVLGFDIGSTVAYWSTGLTD